MAALVQEANTVLDGLLVVFHLPQEHEQEGAEDGHEEQPPQKVHGRAVQVDMHATGNDNNKKPNFQAIVNGFRMKLNINQIQVYKALSKSCKGQQEERIINKEQSQTGC